MSLSQSSRKPPRREFIKVVATRDGLNISRMGCHKRPLIRYWERGGRLRELLTKKLTILLVTSTFR